MTTTETPTTDFTVTFHWAAEAWSYSEGENPDAPMTSSEPVTVTLPSDASPWEVYSEADALDKGPVSNSDVSDWDPDGMTIERNGKSLSLSGYEIKSTTQWTDFY